METQKMTLITAASFILILGQANGAPHSFQSAGGGMVEISQPYESIEDCQDAGEDARANNAGLSFLSYTCVPSGSSSVRDFVGKGLFPQGGSLSNQATKVPQLDGGMKE